MKETKPTSVLAANDREQQPRIDLGERDGIRLLDDYELVLAGGGEGDFDWP